MKRKQKLILAFTCISFAIAIPLVMTRYKFEGLSKEVMAYQGVIITIIIAVVLVILNRR